MSSVYSSETVAVIGAGNMGTAVGLQVARNGHVVRFFSIESDVVADINSNHRNTKYIGDVQLPASCMATGNLAESMNGAKIVVLSVPSHIIPAMMQQILPLLEPGMIIVNLAKGLHAATLKPVGELIEDMLPASHKACMVSMSGPSIANEIIKGVPTTLVIAAKDHAALATVRAVFANDVLRIYINPDKKGVDLGGFLKNIVAIMAGVCDGLGVGMNVKAALMTRGFYEISLLAKAQGADAQTLSGLSCLGDMIVTCFSEHSRNRRFGEALAKGMTPDEAKQKIGQAVEGVIATQLAMEFAKKNSIKLTLIPEIHAIVYSGKDPKTAIEDFFRNEGENEF